MWSLACRDGLAGISLRNLADGVDLRQPSLYAYFESKLDHDAVHDGRIVADIIAEWAATHGEPFTVVLDGPAGGTFVQGIGGEEVRISVVDFVRTLTERTTASGVLQHTLPL